MNSHILEKNVASQLRHLTIMDALDIQSEILDLLRRKRQLIHRIQEENTPPNITDETEYTIELPKDVFNSIQQSQLQLDIGINSRNTALEEAIRTIVGVTSSDI